MEKGLDPSQVASGSRTETDGIESTGKQYLEKGFSRSLSWFSNNTVSYHTKVTCSSMAVMNTSWMLLEEKARVLWSGRRQD